MEEPNYTDIDVFEYQEQEYVNYMIDTQNEMFLWSE